ncbi:peptidoglycan DD-metalloendopeptidase family protein [Paludibacterium sp. B53371]|uniref:peptidoglycan DD-metalloendopeptidase family protein n=1 Tax=Paludibacterium sp. B53371 TaxID=2806263 RepID=UPI001C041CE1|nr:peptidoglycan DD-metalloendopeptidase family protein [Paludibacterium sp. B53371]
MMILPSRRTSLLTTLALVGLCGCSSFVQQPAPVESGSTASPTTVRSTAPNSVSRSVDSAQTTPYKADAPMGSAGPASARPVAVSADDGKTHVVAPGENLFRISLAHGLKYQQVATWNNLPDFSIKVGQVLRLTPPGSETPAPKASTPPATQINGSVRQSPVKTYPKALKLAYSDAALHAIGAESEGSNQTASKSSKPAASAPAVASAPVAGPTAPDHAASAPAASAGDDNVGWIWPVNGKLLRGFSDNNKGIDLGGRMGQAVLAAGDGKVVYSGNGLRGYGKLIIIKHNKTFLSAYAHNSQLLVKEGQAVKKGQKIAEMGNTDADQVKLHFEIRKFGKPVDPTQYLNSKP